MNINEAQRLTGISRQNLRFYEKQGLLHPARNVLNTYRQYSDADIERLKLIRMLRMLDMPLDTIRAVLNGTLSLSEAAAEQQRRLVQESDRLDAAIRVCAALQRTDTAIDASAIDALWARMTQPDGIGGFFMQWLEDYKQVAQECSDEEFTFTPDTEVTGVRTFSEALFAYAKAHEVELVITKESMYPEFTINGVPYTAERVYAPLSAGRFTVPVATVRCHMVHPEEHRASLPPQRRRLMRIFHKVLPFLIIAAIGLIILGPRLAPLLTQGFEGILLVLSLVVMFGSGFYFYAYYYHNNRDGQ